MDISALNPANICLAGDWHMNHSWAVEAMKYAKHTYDADVIVHAGDFGYNFSQKFVQTLHETAIELGMHILFVDGNHENYDYLYNKALDRFGVRPITDRIIHLPRGFRWNWNNVDYMALGGAVSIDKMYAGRFMRVPRVEWWSEEVLTYYDVEYASREGNVDVMITHDCPSGVEIPGITKDANHGWDLTVVRECEDHRDVLAVVVDEVQPKLLVHGHYHVRYDGIRRGKNGNTIIRGLNCDNSSLFDNVTYLKKEK